jgi:hypothetical protein
VTVKLTGRRLIPALDDRLLMLVTQDAKRCRAECIVAPGRGRLLKPSRGKDAKDVAMGEQQDVALSAANFCDHAIDAPANVISGFSVRPAISPE